MAYGIISLLVSDCSLRALLIVGGARLFFLDGIKKQT